MKDFGVKDISDTTQCARDQRLNENGMKSEGMRRSSNDVKTFHQKNTLLIKFLAAKLS